jgi:penicillin amidase
VFISELKNCNSGTYFLGEASKSTFPFSLNIPNKEGKPIGGDTDTPNATAVNPTSNKPYALEFHAASYRQIVDCSNFENSYFIYPTGQSGHLASPHYSDMYEMWRTGKYLKENWSDNQIEDNVEAKLILRPM